MNKILKSGVVAVAALIAAPASVSAIEIAVGPKISTLGVGLEATAKLNDQFNIRLAGNFFKYSRNVPNGKVDYKGDLRMLTLGGMVDFHPWSNGFRISAGAMYNGNKADLKATPSGNVNLTLPNGANLLLTPAQIGTASTTIDFRKFAPYLGLGYDSALHNDEGDKWSFNAEAGVLFQGKPKVSKL